MWNETLGHNHVNENKRRNSVFNLNNNWNVFKWKKNRTSYWPLSLSLFSLLWHISWETNKFSWNHIQIVYFNTRRPASTTRFSPSQTMRRFKWAELYFRLASSSNNTLSITLSLSSSTSLFSSFLFLFFLMF